MKIKTRRSYLKQLPIDKLKIDQSFTLDVLQDEDDAEGVEMKGQADFLLENSCKEAQGYFYYKPQNAKSITKILKLI